MHSKNNIKTFSLTTALLIWFCHIGIAIFFYMKGEEWNLPPYYWAAVFTAVASFPYISAMFKKHFILYEPKYLFLGTFLLTHTAWMFLSLDEIDFDVRLWTYVMKLLVFGSIAFLIGYRLVISKTVAGKLPLSNFVISRDFLLKIPMRLYLMGWTLRLLPIILGRLGPDFTFFLRVIQRLQGWQIMNILMTDSIYTALMIDAHFYFSGFDPKLNRKITKKKHLCRALFFIIAETFFVVIGSFMKEGLLVPIILMFIIYFRAKKKIPYVALILAGILFVGFIMPFMNTYRTHWIKTGDDISTSLSETYYKLYVEEKDEKTHPDAVKRISAPLQMSILGAELRKRGIEVTTYRTIFDYLSRFIPRFLWPDKPVINYNLIGKQIGLLNEDDYVTSISLTLVGSFILSYGTAGVIIGMFLVGFILRILWEWLIVRTGENPFSYMVYSLLLYSWIRLEELPICIHSNLAFLVYLSCIM